MVTNETGETTSVRRFEPFGKPRAPLTGESVTSGFTGHEHDEEFGLINMRGRIYDPEVGRFLERDPLTRPFWSQGMNPYAYVGNNPLNLVDPSGWETYGPESFQLDIITGSAGGSGSQGQTGSAGGSGTVDPSSAGMGGGGAGGQPNMSGTSGPSAAGAPTGMGPMMGPAGPSGQTSPSYGSQAGAQGAGGMGGGGGGGDTGAGGGPTCTMNSPSSAPSGNVNEPGRAVSPGSESSPSGVRVPVGAGLVSVSVESTFLDAVLTALQNLALRLSALTVPASGTVAIGGAPFLLTGDEDRSGPGGTVWTPPAEALSKVPSAWGSPTSTKKGAGVRWQDPNNPGNGVRIDRGNPNNSQELQQVDHVVVNKGGRVLGPNGQPIPGAIKQNPEAHIPLSEWLTWRSWDSP